MKISLLSMTLLLPLLTFGKSVTYSSGEQKFEGVFFSAAKKNSPSIILIHNWMGISAESEKQAQRFQKLGYNVFVADIYGSGVRPKDAKEAGQLAGKYKGDRTLLRERIKLAIDELGKMKDVNKEKMAVLGYCFGGTAAIEAARAGYPMKAAISFHGGLDSPKPEDGANIKGKVLALHGAIDPFVKNEDIQAFENEMQKYKVDYELIKYSGTVHSFTEEAAGSDLSKGAAYNASSDARSFARTKDFLAEAFK